VNDHRAPPDWQGTREAERAGGGPAPAWEGAPEADALPGGGPAPAWERPEVASSPGRGPGPGSQRPPEAGPPTGSGPAPQWQPPPDWEAQPRWQSPAATEASQAPTPRAARLPLRELLAQGVQLDGAGFRVAVTAAALALFPVALVAAGLPDPTASLLEIAAYFFAEAVLVQLLAVLYLRGKPEIRSAYGIAARKVPALVAAALVQVVVVVLVVAPLLVVLPSGPELGLLVAAPIVLFLLARWSLYTQVIVLENAGPLAGLRRSWSLVRGSTLRVLAVLALFRLFSIISTVAVLSLLEGFVTGTLDPVVLTLLGTSVDVVVAPVVPAGLTVAYFDVLGRTERWRFRRSIVREPGAPADGPSPALHA
jgi:hypothetical protein